MLKLTDKKKSWFNSQIFIYLYLCTCINTHWVYLRQFYQHSYPPSRWWAQRSQRASWHTLQYGCQMYHVRDDRWRQTESHLEENQAWKLVGSRYTPWRTWKQIQIRPFKGKGYLFNVGSLRKSPPGMDGTTYFQQNPRCVPLPPRLSSLGWYCW